MGKNIAFFKKNRPPDSRSRHETNYGLSLSRYSLIIGYQIFAQVGIDYVVTHLHCALSPFATFTL